MKPNVAGVVKSLILATKDTKKTKGKKYNVSNIYRKGVYTCFFLFYWYVI